MNFLTNINLNSNELQNVVIQNVATDPSNPKKGQLWFNTSEGVLKYCNASSEIKVVGNLTENELTTFEERVGDLETTINNETSGFGAVSQKAENAASLAGEAKTSADAAKTDATNALSTANSASETAAAAQASAAAATTAASSAQAAANEASTKAASAETVANEAKSEASAATTAASNAQSAAESAQTAADGKVAKVADAVIDNIVIFGANGEIKDSGKSFSDISTGGGEVDTSNLISKVEGAVEGNLSTLSADGSIVDSGYSISATLSSENSKLIPTSNAIVSYIEGQLANIAQGVAFKGIIDTQNNITVPYNAGDMYYVGTAGIYFGSDCEVGDILIAKVSKNETDLIENSDWAILEGNKNIFTGATSEMNGSSGFVPAPEAGALRYLDSTGAWTAPVATRWSGLNPPLTASGNGIAIWSIEHKLGRKDVQVSVYEVINDYEYNQVMCGITLTGTNFCNAVFNTNSDIAEGKYYAVVM